MVKETKIMMKKATITLPPRLLEQYKIYCKDNGMNLSKRIALLMKNDLKIKGIKNNENPNN